MNHLIVRLVTAVAIATVLVLASQPAISASFPAKGKVITWIVPVGAGGGGDTTARTIQPWLEKELGVPVPIVNKPGAGGQLGATEFVKTARTDGYMIYLVILPPHPTTYLDPKRKAAYGRKDFKLVSNFAFDPGSFAVKADSPYKTMKDLVDAAKANPGKIKVTSSGLMSTGHITGLQVEQLAGVKFAHMFYEQQGEQRAALLGGHADVELNPTSEMASGVTSGQLRVLAVCADKPSQFIPDVPTGKAQGFPCIMGSVRGIAVKAGTPDSAVKVLDAAVKKALADPEHLKALEKIMLAVQYMDTKEYNAFYDKFEKSIKSIMASLSTK